MWSRAQYEEQELDTMYQEHNTSKARAIHDAHEVARNFEHVQNFWWHRTRARTVYDVPRRLAILPGAQYVLRTTLHELESSWKIVLDIVKVGEGYHACSCRRGILDRGMDFIKLLDAKVANGRHLRKTRQVVMEGMSPRRASNIINVLFRLNSQ